MSRVLRLPGGREAALPLAMPVYQPRASLVPMERWVPDFGVQALILNAFFLYKDRATRARFAAGERIHDYIGFQGVVMSDSGAFQGLDRPVYLRNRTIVDFQAAIGADVISPLDLITPPWDPRTVAEAKMEATLTRVREAIARAPGALVAGVQQGGRFQDLRRRCTEGLLDAGARYLAIGSLVPFFNKGHALGFVGEVIRDARRQAGPELPIHVYGAGDPVELPFLAAMGADVFDSSAYGHYAKDGWYMTPFGALRELGPLDAGEWRCGCPACAEGAQAARTDTPRLAAHNLFTVMETVRRTGAAMEAGALPALLAEVLERHRAWFPESALPGSWEG